MTPRPRGQVGRTARFCRAGVVGAGLAGLLLLALSACNSATPAGTGSGAPPPSSGSGITVQGTVLGLDGYPLAHADLLVDGKLAATATDGTFTVTGVTTPYDLAVAFNGIVSALSAPTAMVYEGLTLAKPTLVVLASSNTSFSEHVSGTLGRPLDQSTTVTEKGLLLAGGPTYAIGTLALDASNTTNGAFGPLTVDWAAGASRPSTLFALSWDVDTTSNLPTTYTGFAASSLTLDGTDRTGVSVPLSAQGLGTRVLNGSVTPPVGYTLVPGSGCSGFDPCNRVGDALLVRLQDGTSGAALAIAPNVSSADVPQDANGSFDYALVARAVPINTPSAGVSAAVSSAPNLGPNATNNLVLPTPPNPIAPANNATGVGAGTGFSWETLSSSVYLVSLTPHGAFSSTGPPAIVLVTTASHTTLPDLSKLGIQLPAGTAYDYTVGTVGPFSSVDGAVARPLTFPVDYTVLNGLFPWPGSTASSPVGFDFPVPDLRATGGSTFVVTTK